MFGAMKLKLYHQTGSRLEPQLEAATSDLDGVPIFKWQTCMRSLILVPEDLVGERFAAHQKGEWLRGEAAYRCLLEIACGLQSPLVGETEVFGQFKDAVDARIKMASAYDGEEGAFVATLRQWSKALIEDVKMIRQKHLHDLGSQSYGSLVRREIRELNQPHIEFLGAGQLVEEILPWLLKTLKNESNAPEKKATVTVHARHPKKAQLRLEECLADVHRGTLIYKTIESGVSTATGRNARVLIIAAPMSAAAIAAWARDLAHFDLILDLRGESRDDSIAELRLSKRLRSLDEIFSSIEAARIVAIDKKNAALEFVGERVEVREATATHRPFGWEDVC